MDILEGYQLHEEFSMSARQLAISVLSPHVHPERLLGRMLATDRGHNTTTTKKDAFSTDLII